jgi:glutamate racemase
MKIGVFDSGFGGLSVFKAIEQILPEYDYVYLGDSARAPYGNHSHEIIFDYVLEAVQYLFEKQDCALIILACNTASAQALRRLQQEWLPENYPDRRVLGVIRPVAEEIAKFQPQAKIGVIGTRATIKAGVFTKEIEQQLADKADILEQACPLLVPLIEEGFDKRPEMKRILRYYLRPLKQQGVEVLINGCTHYQLVDELITAVMGKRVRIIDSPKIVADSLKDYLSRHQEIDEKLSKGQTKEFFTTDQDGRFDNLASRFYGQPVKAKQVEL